MTQVVENDIKGPSWNWRVEEFPDHSKIVGYYVDGTEKQRLRRKRKPPETFEEFEEFLQAEENRRNPETTRAHRERSLRMAKQEIARKCKMLSVDKLLTFTTRANISDMDDFKSIVTRFLRLYRAKHPEFKYVAVFERHMSEHTSKEKYGSLHLHIAISGYAAYNQLRDSWRTAVQDFLQDGDYKGANFQSDKSKGSANANKIAQYLSKYIGKQLESEEYIKNSKKYWASRNIPKPLVSRFKTGVGVSIAVMVTVVRTTTGLTIQNYWSAPARGGTPPIIVITAKRKENPYNGSKKTGKIKINSVNHGYN